MNELEPEIQQPENLGEISMNEATREVDTPTPIEDHAIDQQPAVSEQTTAVEEPTPLMQSSLSEITSEEEDELLTPNDDQEMPAYHTMDLETLLTHFGDAIKKTSLEGEHPKIRSIKTQIDHWFQKIKAQQELESLEGDRDHTPVAHSPLFLLYQDLWQRYQNRRHQEKQEKEARMQANLELKKAMLEELQQMVEQEEQGKVGLNEQLKELQNRWKECGPVPAEQKQELWNRYHWLHDQFYNNLRINRELKELDLSRNFELKTTLCEQAERLLLETDILQAGVKLSQLHEQWKAIGPVPRHQSDDLWNRFKNVSDRIFQSRRGKFEELDKIRSQNLEAKTKLCENLEILVQTLGDSKPNWNTLSATIDLLQQDWRTTGPVAKDQQEGIWKRFKSGLDAFYSARLQHFKTVKAENQVAAQQRETWCKEAESWQDSEDWKNGTIALMNLQKAWKEAPALPRKLSDKYWQRFRTACDAFFTRKNEFFTEEKSRQSENLQKKEAILAELSAYQSAGNPADDLAYLMQIQKNWGEIGFVPMNRKEALQQQFRTLTNAWFDQLKVNREAQREAQYQQRLDKIVQNPGGEKEIGREQTQIQYKINDLRKEIDLLENNLGFFGRSKNADLMKLEVEKKIQGLKAQLLQAEARLRLLKQSRKENDSKAAPGTPNQESNFRNNRNNTSKSRG